MELDFTHGDAPDPRHWAWRAPGVKSAKVARQRGTLALERAQPTAPADPAPQIRRRCRGRLTMLACPDD